jgi:hypothetical protein
MTRLHFVKRARHDYPDIEVKQGEPYYWWKFKNSVKQRSKERPKNSQLTRSAWDGAVSDLHDSIGAWDGKDAASFVDELKSTIEDMGSQAQESLDNMPEALQEGPTGELLRERVENAENAVSELDSVDTDQETEDDTEEDQIDDSIRQAISDAVSNL